MDAAADPSETEYVIGSGDSDPITWAVPNPTAFPAGVVAPTCEWIYSLDSEDAIFSALTIDSAARTVVVNTEDASLIREAAYDVKVYINTPDNRLAYSNEYDKIRVFNTLSIKLKEAPT